ncbi:S1 domain-containing RNA-binding protein [Secundilactobacillus malefermentans]|uniref:S1 domain-containing RNA-binding protein n=1 Tax=Secundilactobacillus malefermentans TaxID=176292 RepID=UPI0011C7B049|nr:S1 domain-containing RNA-binding protein [Secundilactobacillus malefermentans]QEA31960.1 RNA-binding protein S1 [Secundilactobacillus malefermentans]
MAIEVGAKVSGKVSGITNFGAFVDLGEHKTGLVHISEVSDGFVKDIHDVLSVGDEVTVKVLTIGDDGKIGLSIRKAEDKPAEATHARGKATSNFHNNHGTSNHTSTSNHSNTTHNSNGRSFHGSSNNHEASQHSGGQGGSFDDLMSGFLKDSEDRLATLKRNTEGKRGGRGGRRS